MTHAYPTRLVLRRAVSAAILLTAIVFVRQPLTAQTAMAAEYQKIVARDQAARAATPLSAPAELRRIAGSYETFVRRHPISGYSDNALLQGASLLQLAFERSNDPADQNGATRLIAWLQREYPSSSLVRAAKAVAPTSSSPVSASPAPKAPPETNAPRPTPSPAAAGPASASASGPEMPPSPPLISPGPMAPAGTVAAPAAQATPGAPLAQVRAITKTALPKGERITIELSREVSFSGDRVDNPDRVFFDFANAAIAPAVTERLPVMSGGPIKTVRLGRPQAGTTRVVLEVVGHPRFSAFPLYEPFRLVIDVEADASNPAAQPASSTPAGVPAMSMSSAPVTTSQPSPASTRLAVPVANTAAPPGGSPVAITSPPAAVPPALAAPAATHDPTRDAAPVPPASNSRGDYSLARQLGLGVSRIVIDAGHGGHDPGAQANGVTEAELVLDVALRLHKLLKDHPGLEPVLTRSTDDFIALQERTAIANREGADLFLSIHANASRQPTARGVETYLLNFATNPQAEAVAARENASSGQTMGTLPEILKAIALNNKLSESRELATIVQTSMVRRLSAQNKSMRDLGVKQAPFVVLIGAQMPSVLAEISFVTNKSDAGLLKQNAYRQRIAQALCDAILKYQASLKKVTTIAARDQE